jgi:chemotaxis signal transduction protein
MSYESVDVEALRRAFDERFASAEATAEEPIERLVLARCGTTRIALRLDEIAGVHAAAPLARVPRARASLRGLVAVRGRVVAAFDLAAFLGAGATPERGALLVLARAADDIGLLVSGEIGYADLGAADVDAAIDSARPFVRMVARVGGALCPIVDVPRVVEAIAALGEAEAR